MTEWVPFFQSLLWPLVVVAAFFWFKPLIERMLVAIATRIEQGDSFEAGTSGVKLGSGQKPKEQTGGKALWADEVLPHQVYLVHSTKRAKDLDTEDYEYYRLRIWLDADEPEMLTDISSVTYHLHPTFRDPVRTVSDVKQKFLLRTACWGEFNMYAEVRFKEGQILHIERYIDL